MRSDPLISIVLPTYNGARYLSESIDSCLRQTYESWELIIVDDASTDDTPSIIANYVARDHRIRGVRNSVNRKLPGSLNSGFAEASGEFFTWTSDDNCYRLESLSQMLAVLQANPSIDIVYADFTEIDERGSPIGPGWARAPEELPFGNSIGPCFLYRRTVHEELGGFAEDFFLVEDYDFWLRASASFRLGRLEKDLYLYRRHDSSLTVTQAQRVRLALEGCLAKNLPRMSWMDSKLRTRAYENLVYLAVERGDRRVAWSHLVRWIRSSSFPIRHHLEAAAYLLAPAPLRKLIKWHEPWDWLHRLGLAVKDIAAVIPTGDTFILVDEAQWGRSWYESEVNAAHHVLPFLEKDGQYWGPPEDDETAIREVERQRKSGTNFMVFAWPAFWWLEYYSELDRYLRSTFRCSLENDRLVVFDLRL